MDKKWISQLTDGQKHLVFLLSVGFGVAIVHFTITYILEKSCSSFIKFFFISPSFIISSTTNYVYMKIYFPTITYITLLHSSASFADIIVSSFSYGLAGVLLISKKLYLRVIGAILILIFFLIPIIYYLSALIGQNNA